ncbi:MAG TPA: TRAM domain-containing protein [Candidatus Polarisedimenticolaceae bacterium]|nr:TRAM domain-containing protein [Candidatus Polarisedimenticolaceae bacterium]
MGLFNRNQKAEPGDIPAVSSVPALVDTSVIIDGRIVDIAKAGFAPGKLLVPRFVLAELQLIADSGDAMKRGRGRRGLEMLHSMRELGVDLEIIEDDYDDIKEVDAKLVRLGRKLDVNVLTTDYNLNRVASIEGVRVLNINELANAVRPVILPGEHMFTKIVQPGKEKGQGVGYLADGTMIVVDASERLIGQEVEVEITRVFQTVAGKMLFAVLVSGKPAPKPQQASRPSATSEGDNRPARSPHYQNNRSNQPSGNQSRSSSSSQTKRDSGQRPAGDNAQWGTNSGSAPRAPKNQPSASEAASRTSQQRRPKRVSPTQRLENSLMELTSGDNNPS